MDIARRFEGNPLITPADVAPSIAGAVVECVFNPGAFVFEGRTYLLMRVAERSPQEDGYVSTLVADPAQPAGVRVVRWDLEDPELDLSDPRFIYHDGHCHLTTLSHLRFAVSDNGADFTMNPMPPLRGAGALEEFGLEDCRVVRIDDTYHLTYSTVSDSGVGIGLRTTRDWRTFTDYGMIIPPHNKDGVLFERKINGRYACLNRPSGADVGGHFLWYATSPDLRHWGNYACVARTRPGMWDSVRVGAGAAPILTDRGWLAIYHGCDEQTRYCLGAMLLDRDDPRRVLARGDEPIMEPTADYEREGFFGNVVFTNGHVVDGDKVTVYYGAADTTVCAAELSINEILSILL